MVEGGASLQKLRESSNVWTRVYQGVYPSARSRVTSARLSGSSVGRKSTGSGTISIWDTRHARQLLGHVADRIALSRGHVHWLRGISRLEDPPHRPQHISNVRDIAFRVEVANLQLPCPSGSLDRGDLLREVVEGIPLLPWSRGSKKPCPSRCAARNSMRTATRASLGRPWRPRRGWWG